MPLQLSEVTSDAEFDDIIPVYWASYEDPYVSFMRIMYPVKDSSPEARKESMDESKLRVIGMHRHDPSSTWIKVVNTDITL